jgi:hypothetical protein
MRDHHQIIYVGECGHLVGLEREKDTPPEHNILLYWVFLVKKKRIHHAITSVTSRAYNKPPVSCLVEKDKKVYGSMTCSQWMKTKC